MEARVHILINLIADRSVEDLFGAVVLALAIAGPCALICRRLARRVAEPSAALTAVIMAGNLSCLLVGAVLLHRDLPAGLVDPHVIAPPPGAMMASASPRPAPRPWMRANFPRPFGPPPRPARPWAAFDRDGDGTLSPDEIDAAADVLRRRDADGDGALDARELRPPAPVPGSRDLPSGDVGG